MQFVDSIPDQLRTVKENLKSAYNWLRFLLAALLITGLVLIQLVFCKFSGDSNTSTVLATLASGFLGATLVTVYLEILANRRKERHVASILAETSQYLKAKPSLTPQQIEDYEEQLL